MSKNTIFEKTYLQKHLASYKMKNSRPSNVVK